MITPRSPCFQCRLHPGAAAARMLDRVAELRWYGARDITMPALEAEGRQELAEARRRVLFTSRWLTPRAAALLP